MVQTDITDGTTSTTSYDDSNFPLTDIFTTYLTVDSRNATGVIMVIKNTSAIETLSNMICQVKGSLKPSLTIPAESDPSWVVFHGEEVFGPDSVHTHPLDPTWSWMLIQLKNAIPEQVATAQIWTKVKKI